VLLALSGGADSVFLLRVLAQSAPRPRILAVYVDHHLRGGESASEAAFCAHLCAKLGVPFARREVELDPEGPNLEARAREARYRALADEARAAGLRTILTGHHGDDALETLLLRWMRGSDLPGLAGLKARNALTSAATAAGAPITVVRPLRTMRREEVRCLLRDAGFEWREDSSNADPRFTRNRVRSGLLPEIERACGEGGIENLRAFADAVERLEDELAERTAHLAWSPPAHAAAVGSAGQPYRGGTLARTELAGLAAPLLRRALWRLLSEGTGHPPSRALLAILEDDLLEGRTTRRGLPGGWTLALRREELLLVEPQSGQEATPERLPQPRGETARETLLDAPRVDRAAQGSGARSRTQRHSTPEPAEPAPEASPLARELSLPVPGRVTLPDGRSIVAELVRLPAGSEVPTTETEVELDADGLLERSLSVRSMRAGDRFHGLGAPGSRPLRRFLADAGVPASERQRVPLVFLGDELIWVAGLRPCHARRVRSTSGLRLRLSLRGATPAYREVSQRESPSRRQRDPRR